MLKTLALLMFAEVADFGTTYFASAHGAHEENPVFLAAASSGVLAAFVMAKLGVVPVAGWVVSITPARHRNLAEGAVRFAAAMLLGVAASNILVAL